MAAWPHIETISSREPDPRTVQAACGALLRGELVVMPTETVYGVAADPQNEEAMKRLYTAKGRSTEKAVALFAPDLGAVAREGAELSPAAKALAAAFWPGPLTLVLPSTGGALGFRVPDHPVPLAILHAFGRVLAVTSANRSGRPEALTAAEAARELGDAVSLVLDGGRSQGAIPSTVLRLAGNQAILLREGAIARDRLAAVLQPLGLEVS